MPDPSSQPHLSCTLDIPAGSLRVEAQFDLHAPWTCLFGYSGSGKTTILRALAGLLRPRTGVIRLGTGRTLFESRRGLSVPAHRRPFRLAAQHPWLFPGTVLGNVGFGVDAPQPKRIVDEVLTRFELTSLARHDVRALSGGQRQRVSLARTVASALGSRAPVVLLLLDEPFTGLDLELRNRLALDLRDWLRSRHLPVLSVTHEIPETLLLEAETIRLHEGRIVGQGPAAAILAPEIASLRKTLT